MYFSKVEAFAEGVGAFYFRQANIEALGYDTVPLGIHSLSKILKLHPDKLCAMPGLPRKTAHCWRITCASKLFQSGVEEKLIRERTGHRF